MPAEPTALSKVPPPEPPADTDYDAICAAVTATARGRWFLDEFAKRNRNSDTSEVLAAIARMEATVVGERTQQASRDAHQEVRIELLEMARTIAQARAEVAESRPQPSPQGTAEPTTGAVTPDVAAAAERLRQIAWTMRACGIELPASDQIGQIAETILSADAMRGLGEQRAQKLTEALLYLEQRIDRMLDGHRAAATSDTEPAADAPPPPNRDERGAPLATAAVAMIAAAMRANAAAAAEAVPATTIPERTAPAASDIAEYPMDDDVVLTVADGAIAPAVAASLAVEPEPATVEPAPTADTEPAVRVDARAPAPQAERVELEVEPLLPAKPPAEDDAEAEFAGLQLEPLAIAPAVVVEPPSEPQPAAVEETPIIAAEEKPVDPPPAIPSAVDDAAADLPVDAPLPATAATPPEAEPVTADSGANDDLPPTLAADAAAVAEPQAIEPEATEADAIAQQVDKDLDDLAEDAPDHDPGDAPAQSPPAPARPQLVHAAEREDEPAEFLLEEAPRKVPVSALVASAQASRAQLSDTLAAIESELFGSTRPPADTPSGPAEGSIPAKPARAATAEGPLGALMAMSEEERIALFS